MLKFPRRSSSVLIVLTLILSDDGYLCQANNLKSGISYRIRNGWDGSVLTAQHPSLASDLTLKLGNATTEEWSEVKSQIWSLHLRSDQTSKPIDLFWLKPEAAVLNILTGIPMDKEFVLEIREITRDSETYTVRDPGTNLCLQGQGSGKNVFFNECDEIRVAQQWDFDDLAEQKLKNKAV